jgi:hypothetical protein
MDEIYWWHKTTDKYSCSPKESPGSHQITTLKHNYQINPIDKYQIYIQDLMEEYMNLDKSYDDQVEKELLFDTIRHRYQLVYVGWQGQQRIYGCVLHIDIKDYKIWIQYDCTKINIAEKLMAKGVPKDDIVLGFRFDSR